MDLVILESAEQKYRQSQRQYSQSAEAAKTEAYSSGSAQH